MRAAARRGRRRGVGRHDFFTPSCANRFNVLLEPSRWEVTFSHCLPCFWSSICAPQQKETDRAA
jgi:hypothetical protein